MLLRLYLHSFRADAELLIKMNVMRDFVFKYYMEINKRMSS